MTLAIEQALIQHFIDAEFGLPIAYENGDYDATDGNAYAELNTFINDVTAFSLNDNDQTDGYLQIILRYPEGGYSIDAKTMADTILSEYKIGQRLTYSGQKITINRKSIAQGANESGWYKLVLRVFFTAVLPR